MAPSPSMPPSRSMSASHLRLLPPPAPPEAEPFPAASEEAALVVAHLHAGYGPHKVLQDIALTVPAGGITALMGPLGAGKSTLLHAICGRLPAKAGEIRVCGIPAGEDEARRRIGLVPQGIALYPSLTITENLAVFGELSGLRLPQLRERVAHVLALTGTVARQDQRIERLSPGWQRRANVAAALVSSPRLLLLDEPTSGMDDAAREDLATLLRDLAGEGLGVLLVTQDFGFAERIAGRVAILKSGRVVLEGVLADLIEQRFAHSREVEVTFASPPTPLRLGLLASLGLSAEGASARGMISDAPRAVGELLTRLEGIGLPPRAFTVKSPGLAALYSTLMSRDV